MQVTAANLAKQLPQAFHYIDDTLVPGGWVRESLSPYIRCQFKSGGKGPCVKERQRLFDMEYVRNGTNLPLLVELLETQGLASQQFIVYGCSLIVLSALFSLYYSVKTAVLGFVLLGYGIYEVRGHNGSALPVGTVASDACSRQTAAVHAVLAWQLCRQYAGSTSMQGVCSGTASAALTTQHVCWGGGAHGRSV